MRNSVKWDKVQKDLARMEAGVSTAGILSFMEHALHWTLQALAADTIDDQMGPGREPWVPLKESTKRIRAALPGIQPDRPINFRTGNLQRYLESAPASYVPGPGGLIMSFPGDAEQNSTRLMYAYHTAQGGSSRWGTPARPVVGLGSGEIAAIHMTTVVYINELLGMDYGNSYPWVEKS